MRQDKGAQGGMASERWMETASSRVYFPDARAEGAAQPAAAKAGTRKKGRADLRFRLAYTKPELSMLLPFGHTTLEELIKKGAFPDGLRPHPTAHKIWPRRVIEDWLEKSQARRSEG